MESCVNQSTILQTTRSSINHCTNCDVYFANRYNLRRHRNNIHYKIKPFQCLRCENKFAAKSDCKKHSTTHIPLQCQFCKKKIENKFIYNFHISTHKECYCRHCEKTISNKYDFNKHILAHAGEQQSSVSRIFVPLKQCIICNIYFLKPDSLKRHINNIHCMIKPFQCSCCNKKFATKVSCNNHIRTHEEKQCQHCEKKFANKFVYNSHIMTHMREEHFE